MRMCPPRDHRFVRSAVGAALAALVASPAHADPPRDGGTSAVIVRDAGLARPSIDKPVTVNAGPPLEKLIGDVARVRVRDRTAQPDGRLKTRTYEITSKDEIAALLRALGADRAPGGPCPRCPPLALFIFLDKVGTSHGDLGLFCRGGSVKDVNIGQFRPGQSQDCRAHDVTAPDEVRRLLERLRGKR
jgi:hypothetical protein